MDGAPQLIELEEAASMLGVDSVQLRQQVDAGNVPSAVFSNHQWHIPLPAVRHIAQQFGWYLDEPAPQEQPAPNPYEPHDPYHRQETYDPQATYDNWDHHEDEDDDFHGHDTSATNQIALTQVVADSPLKSRLARRFVSQTASAHAAVVLAKSQASAARSEASDLARKLQMARLDLEAEQAEKNHSISQLIELERDYSQIANERDAAAGQLEALATQLEYERRRTKGLEASQRRLRAEQERAYSSLGWLGRYRLRASED